MIKRMVIMLIAVGVVLGGVFGFETFRNVMIKKFMASMGNQPQTVATAKAEEHDWQPHLEAVGSLKAVNGADLSVEVPGIVDAISFNSGDEVAAGALLLRLRADDDIAKLHSLEALADLANITYQRDSKQLAAQAISQAVVDTDAANLKNAKAQVAQQQAVVDKKMLHAPFAGRLGIRAVDLGQYINAGTAVVTLQALDPIFIDFSLPEQDLSQIRTGQTVDITVDSFPGQTFSGRISAIDPKIDVATRNVQVRATLPNPKLALLPGMYARVEIDTGVPTRHLTLPQTAITFSPYGDTVYLVENKGSGANGQPQLAARQTFVTVGPTRGDQVAVLKGIHDGDTVVVAGQVKLRNGSPLVIDNSVEPLNNAAPTPVDR
jgi:membrane fusion protein (multidrug efflux system)